MSGFTSGSSAAPSGVAEGVSRAQRRPVLCISMSSALAMRNFFQTGVVDLLRNHFEIEVIAMPAIAATLRELGFDQKVRLITGEVGREPLLWRLCRQLKKKVYMEGRASATEAIWEKFQQRPAYQRLGGWVVKRLIYLIDPNRLYNWLEALDMFVNRDTRFVGDFRQRGIILFFATHATTYFEECLFRNMLAAGIPRVYMVLSWDHLSSKVLLHNSFDRILVWNEHTRRELLATYRNYKPEQVRVVGIPQYDVYAQAPGLTYAAWCARYGLDSGKRTVLFSSMPQVRHNQQHLILRTLLEAMRVGVEVPPDLQVLLKCHPFDNFDGYDQLLGTYPFAIRRTALPRGRSIDHWQPSVREIEESRDCLYFCALNINIFSTVTIEAAMCDKPIVHIGFDPLPVEPGRIPCAEYYRWEHFRPIMEFGASSFVRSYAELFHAVREACANPSERAPERARLVAEYVGSLDGRASARVVRELTAALEAASGSPSGDKRTKGGR